MSYRAIGFGEADVEIERELADTAKSSKDQEVLVKSGPPVAQSVYVCGWCYSIVDLVSLNWSADDVFVCDSCAENYFAK